MSGLIGGAVLGGIFGPDRRRGAARRERGLTADGRRAARDRWRGGARRARPGRPWRRRRGGAVAGFLGGFVLGGAVGAFSAITFAWHVAIAIGLALFLGLAIALMLADVASRGIDTEALKRRFYPQATHRHHEGEHRVGEGSDAARAQVLAAREALGRRARAPRGVGADGGRHPGEGPAQPRQGRRPGRGRRLRRSWAARSGLFRRAKRAVLGPSEPLPTSMLPKEIDKALKRARRRRREGPRHDRARVRGLPRADRGAAQEARRRRGGGDPRPDRDPAVLFERYAPAARRPAVHDRPGAVRGAAGQGPRAARTASRRLGEPARSETPPHRRVGGPGGR